VRGGIRKELTDNRDAGSPRPGGRGRKGEEEGRARLEHKRGPAIVCIGGVKGWEGEKECGGERGWATCTHVQLEGALERGEQERGSMWANASKGVSSGQTREKGVF
jgi:hypothetical protein